MSNVTTRGYGNGTFAGTRVVTMGYGIGVVVVPPDRRRRIPAFSDSRIAMTATADIHMRVIASADTRLGMRSTTDDRRRLPQSTDDRRPIATDDVS